MAHAACPALLIAAPASGQGKTTVVSALARLDVAADALADTPLGRMSMADLQRWAVEFAGPGAQGFGHFAPCPPPALRAPPLPAQNAQTPTHPTLLGKTVAVARDAAFCFTYAANLDCLRDLGAEIVFFSPLADSALPMCDAVWLPGVVTMHQRLAGLGPQQLALPSGTLRGHTFHYSTTATALVPITRSARPDTAPQPGMGEALWQQGSVRASYFHAWFPSCPQAVVELFTAPTGGVA